MSNYCNCCASDTAYVREHLGWNQAIRVGMDADAEALACIEFWRAQGDACEIDPDDLAVLFLDIAEGDEQNEVKK